MNLPTHSSAISESSANGAARLGTPSAHDCAALIAEHFANYNATFRTITRRAPLRFDARDWHASQRDAVERIELYGQCINTCIAELRLALGERVLERALWRGIRADFAKAVAALPDAAFAKTFFSTVTRRLFGTVGVDPEIEFIATELEPLGKLSQDFATRSYQNRGSLELLIEDLLADLEFKSPWRDFDRSVQHLSADIKAHLATIGERRHVQRIDVIPQVFYQATRAYVVGRIRGREYALPLVIALKNTERGVLVDAVMLSEDDVSIVFSFTRSYFHVDLDRVADTVGFLKQLMPRKPVSELFTVLGRTRQGKAERYREIVEHLQRTDDLFVHAPGERGLVMICFTSPSLDVVFKLIRDRFAPPKTIVRQDVIDKYRFVFKHDRAGRL
ncbi:MAG: bifunctional isocitrate dehydrogenase kinase/phosphatase, partial [Steroidobacteraceae bacterium]|nr:bifunctional isocitrate dehydrogenase kinase/phosphatase [Steroidobacteraceae bacterium]MDW8258478.1 isocitrate dehydrogenase kinase/phosphatase-domain containing protein [Gammaproteobacteria bacterium]